MSYGTNRLSGRSPRAPSTDPMPTVLAERNPEVNLVVLGWSSGLRPRPRLEQGARSATCRAREAAVDAGCPPVFVAPVGRPAIRPATILDAPHQKFAGDGR